MSTIAAARVETKIVLQGGGNAADEVQKVRKGLDGLDSAAANSQGAFGKLRTNLTGLGKEGSEAAGDVEKGLLGIRDLVGKLPGPLANIADAFGGAEKILQVLPGPLGLLGAGIVAAGAAAYLLNKNLTETEAKVRNLGDASTRGLADSLGVSVDQAIKLQQAMADLPAKLRPTVGLLDVVRKRAESMGLDGAAAQAKFTEALAKGPEALKAFEREFGRLARASAELPDVAARLGLSRDALGIAAATGNEVERAKTAAQQAVTLEREHQALREAAAQAERDAANANSNSLRSANEASTVAHERAATAAVLVKRAVDEANALQEVADKQKSVTEAAAARQANAASHAAQLGLAEAQAATILDSQARLRAQGNVLSARAAEIGRRIVELQDAKRAGLLDEVGFQRELLGLQTDEQRNVAARQALVRQAQADRKAASDRERARQDAEITSEIKLAKVRADAAEASVLPTNVVGLRRRELALEEAAEVQKAERSVNTAKGRALAIEAIEREFAARRRALEAGVTEAGAKLADENLRLLQGQADRSKAIAAETTAAVAGAAKARATSLAGSLRAAGKDEQADLVELRQAHVDYAAARDAINDRITADQSQFNAESEDHKNLELRRIAELSEAQLRLDDAEAAIAQRRKARQREQIAAAIEQSVAGPAALLRGMSAESAKVAEALQGVAAGAAVVARNWGDLGKAAPGAISAVGSVATAFVDGEREKAAILAIMETAATIAAIAVEDYAGAAAHGAAAVLYGGIAAGAIGSRSGGAGAPAGAGGFAAGSSTATTGGQQQQGSATVININTPLTSRQDVAKGISSGLRSLGTTGYAKSKGA